MKNLLNSSTALLIILHLSTLMTTKIYQIFFFFLLSLLYFSCFFVSFFSRFFSFLLSFFSRASSSLILYTLLWDQDAALKSHVYSLFAQLSLQRSNSRRSNTFSTESFLSFQRSDWCVATQAEIYLMLIYLFYHFELHHFRIRDGVCWERRWWWLTSDWFWFRNFHVLRNSLVRDE